MVVEGTDDAESASCDIRSARPWLRWSRRTRLDEPEAICSRDAAGRTARRRIAAVGDQRTGAGAWRRKRLTEMAAPNVVVGLIDDAVAVAIGAGERSDDLAFRVPPHGIVGIVDRAIVVVVAKQEIESEEVIFDFANCGRDR